MLLNVETCRSEQVPCGFRWNYVGGSLARPGLTLAPLRVAVAGKTINRDCGRESAFRRGAARSLVDDVRP